MTAMEFFNEKSVILRKNHHLHYYVFLIVETNSSLFYINLYYMSIIINFSLHLYVFQVNINHIFDALTFVLDEW